MTGDFEAFWLPGLDADAERRVLDAGTVTCRYPSPTPELLDAAIDRLRGARDALAGRPVLEIVDAIDAAAARLADPDDMLRAHALRLLPAASGYSPEMGRFVLDRMVADWRAGPLRGLLESELGDIHVLDGFAPGSGQRSRAYGPGLSFHVFAGNVPGVAVTSLIRSLLVKSPTFAKTAAREPILPILFAQALASVDPALGDALAVTYWPGGAEHAERRLLEAADLVVVYGGNEAVASLRARAPADRRIVIHGPRFSAALVGRAALDADRDGTASALARSVAMFDQHGCVSPHAVWVEDPGGGAALRFAQAVADAMDRLEDELPRGAVSPAEASAIQQARGAAEMRGHGGTTVRVLAGAGTRWTVVYDEDPGFRPSCLNRFVHVHPVESLEQAIAQLAPVGDSLQSVAVAGDPAGLADLAGRLAAIGASRITTLDRLPWPPPDWHHDGRGPLRELIRWVDLEE